MGTVTSFHRDIQIFNLLEAIDTKLYKKTIANQSRQHSVHLDHIVYCTKGVRESWVYDQKEMEKKRKKDKKIYLGPRTYQ